MRRICLARATHPQHSTSAFIRPLATYPHARLGAEDGLALGAQRPEDEAVFVQAVQRDAARRGVTAGEGLARRGASGREEVLAVVGRAARPPVEHERDVLAEDGEVRLAHQRQRQVLLQRQDGAPHVAPELRLLLGLRRRLVAADDARRAARLLLMVLLPGGGALHRGLVALLLVVVLAPRRPRRLLLLLLMVVVVVCRWRCLRCSLLPVLVVVLVVVVVGCSPLLAALARAAANRVPVELRAALPAHLRTVAGKGDALQHARADAGAAAAPVQQRLAARRSKQLAQPQQQLRVRGGHPHVRGWLRQRR